MEEKLVCFACGKKIKGRQHLVDCEDDQQFVTVGPDCYKKIKKSGIMGYRPPKGGPRLVLSNQELTLKQRCEIIQWLAEGGLVNLGKSKTKLETIENCLSAIYEISRNGAGDFYHPGWEDRSMRLYRTLRDKNII
jgi:hypothetical protein